MKFSAVVSVSFLLSVSQARITGISVPGTIRPGDGFNMYILVGDYPQDVYDVAIAVGCNAGAGYFDSLGSVASSYYLGPEQSNQKEKIPKWISLPINIAHGDGVVTASLLSLFDTTSNPILSDYRVNVTFGDTTSTQYVNSEPI